MKEKLKQTRGALRLSIDENNCKIEIWCIAFIYGFLFHFFFTDNLCLERLKKGAIP
jgi:hypothetical protein